MPRREQYTGCLLGLALGDALGFPVEGMSLERIRRTFGPAGVEDFVDGGWLGLPHGTVSDDTQITMAVARAVEKASPKRILEELTGLVARLSDELEASLKKVKECEGMEPSEAFARFGETGSAEEVFASALFCFLRTPEDYRATVLAGANSNGDSDSIAAQAGALSGAYNGAAAIPEKWRRGVENAAELERLASELFTHASGGY
ncbi:MAG: ADP-ribosylglycohydrolase family protein [Terriglobia bacterium]